MNAEDKVEAMGRELLAYLHSVVATLSKGTLNAADWVNLGGAAFFEEIAARYLLFQHDVLLTENHLSLPHDEHNNFASLMKIVSLNFNDMCSVSSLKTTSAASRIATDCPLLLSLQLRSKVRHCDSILPYCAVYISNSSL